MQAEMRLSYHGYSVIVINGQPVCWPLLPPGYFTVFLFIACR